MCIESGLEAVKRRPNDSILHTLLGSAHFESGQYEDAREAQEKALQVDPNNLYSRYNLALTLQALGSPKALQAWEEYLQKSDGVAEQATYRAKAVEYHEKLKSQKPK
jgi:tetratricopeptide (TPR) repeat protein